MTVKITAVNTHEYRPTRPCTTVIPFPGHSISIDPLGSIVSDDKSRAYITKMAEPRVSFTMTQKASKKSLIKISDSEENTKDVPRNVDFIHSLEDQEIKRLFDT